MRFVITLFSVSLLLAGTLPALAANDDGLTTEHLLEAARLRDQAREDNNAWDIVESLTTDVGPRLAGTEADLRGVAWAEQMLESLNFDRVWKEPVTFRVWHRGKERASVTSPSPQPLVIAALGGSGPTPEGGLEAEIVHFETYQDLLEAEPGSLEGKIAFISNRMERARDGSGYGPAVIARSQGAIEAAERGAQAILIRSIGTSDHRFAHTGNMRTPENGQTIPAAAVSGPDGDQLERLLQRGEPVRVHLELGSQMGEEFTSYNVIAQLDGSEAPEELIIIGGHLDSWDQGTGAVDNAAGVGITVAAADFIAREAERPRRSIRVILWAAEEIGLIGARQYVERHADDMHNHIIGSESDFGAGPVWAVSSRVREDAVPTFAKIAAVLSPLGVEYHDHNRAGGGPDLIPKRQAGMAVASLHQDGTDYFDLHHTPNDTLDKIKPENLDQNVAAYVAWTWLMANTTVHFGPIDGS